MKPVSYTHLFAYILATVANRTSSIDVEQILGRILRLPNTKKNKSEVLNLSYVITSVSYTHLEFTKEIHWQRYFSYQLRLAKALKNG